MRVIMLSCVFMGWFSCWGQDQKNITLLDHWFYDSILSNSSNVRFSGCYGFTIGGIEYGVIGSTEGAHIFQISEQETLAFIDFVPGAYVSSQAITREYKTFDHYLYATCDEGTSSLQIIDLSYLPDSVHLVADLQGNAFGKTHNIFIDSTNQLLYACTVTPIVNGSNQGIIPLCVYSLQNPIVPSLVYAGMYQVSEVHDLYVRDNIAMLNCGYEGIQVFDFSNPSQPVYLNALAFYNYQGYNHQGWLTPNGKTYVFADETAGLPVKKCEVLDDYSIIPRYFFGTNNDPIPKTAHNIHCTDDFAFIAYYVDGLRIYNISNGAPYEVAYYDTYNETPNTNFSMWGAWGIYALFNSNRILMSDRNAGFFLFKFDASAFNQITIPMDFVIYPNPGTTGGNSVIRSKNDQTTHFQVHVYNLLGQQLFEGNSGNQSVLELPSSFANGSYRIRVDFENYLLENDLYEAEWVLMN